MTQRELNLAIFEGTTDKVLWQPRLVTWLGQHYGQHTLPERFATLYAQPFDEAWLSFHDLLHCSMRYYHHSWGAFEVYDDPDEITRTTREEDNHYIVSVHTPHGALHTVFRDAFNAEGQRINRRIEKYPVTNADELRLAMEILEHRHYRPHPEVAQHLAVYGERGEPTAWCNSSGFTELIKTWCGLEGAFYLWADDPDTVEAYLEVCDRLDDRQLDALLTLPHRIVNFGDHATNEFTPPIIMERYMLPRWQRLTARLHAHGRFAHSHWDGNARALLRFARETGLDAIEALTPAPQGDITLEEIKAAVGDDIICLDLIPAIMFMEQYTLDEVLEFTRKAIDLFAPKLILGISDEISQVGQIEKVEAITALVAARYGGVE